jgi:predicted ATPase
MITQVRIKNFRSIAEACVDLREITVLAGRNGAGKSTFFHALEMLRDLVAGNLAWALNANQGFSSIRRWSPAPPSAEVSLGVTLVAEEFWAEYDVTIGEEEGRPVVREETGRVGHEAGGTEDEFRRRGVDLIRQPKLLADTFGIRLDAIQSDQVFLHFLGVAGARKTLFGALREAISGIAVYSIYAQHLREPQRVLSEPQLLSHGENAASVLQRLEGSPEHYDLVGVLRRVVGDIEDLKVDEVSGYLITRLVHAEAGGGQPAFELARESEGTLRLLGLLMALYQTPIPPFIGIEEPELHIHPGALGVIADVLREAALRTQIVVATQSPDLISRFRAEELRVVERIDGKTEIGGLAEHQREALEQQLFSAGDLLRIEGLARAPVKGRSDA